MGVHKGMRKNSEESLNAWRAACRYLYELINKEGPNGLKPKDCISRADYLGIIAAIGKADALDIIEIKPSEGIPLEEWMIPYKEVSKE